MHGKHVVLDGDAVRVTATSASSVWIQDAESSGLCERDGDRLVDAGLEAVLVQTAGQPASRLDAAGAWSLATCFSPTGAITISPALFGSRPSSYQWVTGVIDHTAAGVAVLPRASADVFAVGDDACL